MKVLKYLLYLVGLLVLVGVILPSKTHLERSIELTVSKSAAFEYLNNIRNFNNWSPWHGIDPDTRYEFTGPRSGVGAKMRWDSDNSNVGKGTQEIVNSVPDSRVDIALAFEGMGTASASYILRDGEQGANVTWAYEGDHGWNLISRYMGFFMLETFLGPMYEEGLGNLKQILEAQKVPKLAERFEIATEEIDYQVGAESFTGFIAYPQNGSSSAGILVVHEWWGHNDYARHRAEMLAREGYTAFALDMYGSGKLAEHPDDAAKFMNAVFAEAGAAKARFEAAMDILKARETVNPERLAAIGYCFGGATVLNMARAGLDLKGVVSFHGNLATQSPAQPGQVKAKVLVYHGNEDPFVPAEQVTAFKTEMDAAGVDYSFTGFDGAKHSFTNPGADAFAEKFDMPLAYSPQADAESWKGMLTFFETLFE